MPEPINKNIMAAAKQAVKALTPDVEEWKQANGGKLPSEGFDITNATQMRYAPNAPVSAYVLTNKSDGKTVVIVDDPKAQIILTESEVRLGNVDKASRDDFVPLPGDDKGDVEVTLVANKGAGGLIDLSKVEPGEKASFQLNVAEGNPALRLSNDTKAAILIDRVTDGSMRIEVPASLASKIHVKREKDEGLNLAIGKPGSDYKDFVQLGSDANNVALHVLGEDGEAKGKILLKGYDGVIFHDAQYLEQEIKRAVSRAAGPVPNGMAR